MIKKRNNSAGLNTNVNVDPSASSNTSANASTNISNHFYSMEQMRLLCIKGQRIPQRNEHVSRNSHCLSSSMDNLPQTKDNQRFKFNIILLRTAS